MSKKSDNIHIRCSPEFKQRITELAKKKHRTVSSQIISIIEDAIRREELIEAHRDREKEEAR